MRKKPGLRSSVGLTVIVGALALIIVPLALAAAVNTTDNPGETVNGKTTLACLHGPSPSVNCNQYQQKEDVFLSGSPSPQYDGTYYFAVLEPGGQPDPNPGAPKLLSSDSELNRQFSLSGGTISTNGTHLLADNKLSAFPYDDTGNPGGVYILAVCKISNTAGDYKGSISVKPSSCKYDAFKVKESETPGASAPTIVKDAEGSYDKTYTWTIDKKVVDATTATIKYEITVQHDAGAISNVKVTGTISVLNPNTGDIENADVTDELSDGTVCDVTGGEDATLASGNNDFPFECDLAGLPAGQLDNTATVAWPEQTVDGGTLAAGSVDFTFEDIQFTGNAIDECIDVVDDHGTPADTSDDVTLGTVCVGDDNPTTFKYSITLSITDGQCKTITNTSTFTTNDTGATGSDSETVTYCAPATPGYWKQHLASPSAGPWYDALCIKKNGLPTGTGCSNNGVWTKQYLPISLGGYSVDTILKAANVWFAMNCSNTGSDSSSSSTQRNNALGCLAGHLLAAKLNVANGSPTCINATIAAADALLAAKSYNGPGTYSLTQAERNLAISLKSKLDTYNNGGGCP